MDSTAAALQYALFLATERAVSQAGGKVDETVNKPVETALLERPDWSTVENETALRWRAFNRAFRAAQRRFVESDPNPDLARPLQEFLAQSSAEALPVLALKDYNRLIKLIRDLEQAPLLAANPKLDELVELSYNVLALPGPDMVSQPEVAVVVARFIEILQAELAAQPAYQAWQSQPLQADRQVLTLAEAQVQYRKRLVEHHKYLHFGDASTLQSGTTLPLEAVWIDLPVEEIAPLSESNRLPHPAVSRQLAASKILRHHKQVVILGGPGTGKTTLLQRILLTFATDQNGRLPLFVSLHDYVTKRAGRSEEFSLIDYLYAQANTILALDLPPDFFEMTLAKGNCCLALDGLDMIEPVDLRYDLVRTITALLQRYPQNCCLVTSRETGYRQAAFARRDFVHYRLLPLRQQETADFIQRWAESQETAPAQAAARTEQLIETIRADRRLQQLAANPLLLTLMAMLHRPGVVLPQRRTSLYKHAVTLVLDSWGKAAGLSSADQQRPFYRRRRVILRQLAAWLFTRSDASLETGWPYAVGEGDLRLQIIQFLREDPTLELDRRTIWKEAADFIEMVKNYPNLLAEQGAGLYAFRQRTVLAYLAAEHIKYSRAQAIDEMWALIQPHLQTFHWRELLLFLLGSLRNFHRHPTTLIHRVYKKNDVYEPLLHRYLFLTARMLAETGQVEATLTNAIIDDLLALVRHDRLGWRDAVDALARLPHYDRARAGLLFIAEELNLRSEVRLAAIWGLAQQGQNDAAHQLLAVMIEQDALEPQDRVAAALVLGDLGQPEAMGRLLESLVADTSLPAGVRCVAAATYEQLDQDRAGALLLSLVEDSGLDVAARTFTAEMLEQLGYGRTAARQLLDLAGDGRAETRVRREALEALGQLTQLDEADIRSLLDLAEMQDVDSSVRRAALAVVGQVERVDETVVNQLQQIATAQERSAGMRIGAAAALSRLGQTNEAVIEVLLALAEDEKTSGWVRRDAAVALGRVGQAAEATRLLSSLAADSGIDARVRCDAAWGLSRLQQRDQAAHLLQTLAEDESVSAWIRREAVTMLGQLDRAPLAASLLLELAEDSDSATSVRHEALLALGQIGPLDESLRLKLLAIAQNDADHDNVRQAAYHSLKTGLYDV